jgi:hypothetical protein
VFVEQTDILQALFDNKVMAILKLFIKEEGKQFYLREIAKLTKVSPATTYRILNKLVLLQILKVTEIKTAKLYNLEAGKQIDFLKTLVEVDVVSQFVEKVSLVPGVEEIYLYGKKDKNKADVFLIGSNIDKNPIKQLISDCKTQYSFNILDSYYTKEQYEQTQRYFTDSKKLLYRKA